MRRPPQAGDGQVIVDFFPAVCPKALALRVKGSPGSPHPQRPFRSFAEKPAICVKAIRMAARETEQPLPRRCTLPKRGSGMRKTCAAALSATQTAGEDEILVEIRAGLREPQQ